MQGELLATRTQEPMMMKSVKTWEENGVVVAELFKGVAEQGTRPDGSTYTSWKFFEGSHHGWHCKYYMCIYYDEDVAVHEDTANDNRVSFSKHVNDKAEAQEYFRTHQFYKNAHAVLSLSECIATAFAWHLRRMGRGRPGIIKPKARARLMRIGKKYQDSDYHGRRANRFIMGCVYYLVEDADLVDGIVLQDIVNLNQLKYVDRFMMEIDRFKDFPDMADIDAMHKERRAKVSKALYSSWHHPHPAIQEVLPYRLHDIDPEFVQELLAEGTPTTDGES